MVWNARLQPTTEYSVEQMETETSQSPTGTVQSFSPTWEMLQVASFSNILYLFLFSFIHRSLQGHVITQETTARLLFMAVRWVRCLPPFQTISKDDQLLLLERSWTQLFLLHLAQWSVSWDITALLDDEQVRGRLPTDDNLTNQELVLIQVYQFYLSFIVNYNDRQCNCFGQIIFLASTNFLTFRFFRCCYLFIYPAYVNIQPVIKTVSIY